MLLFRSGQAEVLIGFLLIVQGLCLPLPLPEQKARIVRDTAVLPTELFRPVGKHAGNEPTYNRANSTGEQYTASDESDSRPRFLERFDGYVEEVTAQNDEEENYHQTYPLILFGSDPRGVPRAESSIIRRPFFPSSSELSDTRSIFNPEVNIRNTPPRISRPIQSPIVPNNFRRQFSGPGLSGPFGTSSSNNFHRSESYSYSSDGRGPPQIERNVYDSRNGLGGVSIRNF